MIRETGHEDGAILAEIIRRSFRDVADRFSLTPVNCPTHPSNCEPSWIAQSMGSGARFYLLSQDGIACGCVAMRDREDRAVELERLAVLPEYRGRGLGKALVEHGAATAASQGRSRVDIAIISEHTDLRRWYEHLGFHETSTRQFAHLPFDVTFMSLDLTQDL